jgi:TPP-dependent trihydroxycyclohexane-1,2-dione (THcHDO) dehydratase
MVHASVGLAKTRNRLQAMACTASIGPGSTNMVTGAALATINRIPVLLPSDYFATRAASPLLQELEDPRSYDVSVNDAFKPVSRFRDRINRPEQLLAAMRVLTDLAKTGAVTLALPQDVQAEAHDWPEELFTERVWFIPRPQPEPSAPGRAVEVLRSARTRPGGSRWWTMPTTWASDRTTVVYVETDPLAPVPSAESWWDVPVSETSALESTQRARAACQAAKRAQKLYL